ncbi:DUF91 domain-containing protein, partial [Candidatus Acetothermia bacterium]|nr:DUF91 domain-containing protein [Candidatus Acetothermia bacterium]MBI3643096.1 DUF91 domain-containing protein [Candidatus Acetothermia bacterium]
MSLPEIQIKELLNWFESSSETRKAWMPRRIEALKANQQWIKPEIIKQLSNERLSTEYRDYFNSGGGRQRLNAIHRDRIIRDIDKFRGMILYLLDESIDIKERLDMVLGGSHRIDGCGRALVTSFLLDFNPVKYGLWNQKTEDGLTALGWEVPENKDSWGVAYMKIQEALNKLIDLSKPSISTLLDIDLFLHTIAAESEGIEAVKAVLEDRKIRAVLAESNEIAAYTPEKMNFELERYLEEFLASNFERILWGSNLELYQEDERPGRQYKIGVGVIDLLAIDKDKKEFVVIELKRATTSAATVGQIASYIGWLQENLPRACTPRTVPVKSRESADQGRSQADEEEPIQRAASGTDLGSRGSGRE